MREVTVTVNNGTPHKVFTNDIVKFLSEIDAQHGKLENSGMEHLIKNKIEIEEDNGEKWWSPLSPSEVYKAMARA